MIGEPSGYMRLPDGREFARFDDRDPWPRRFAHDAPRVRWVRLDLLEGAAELSRMERVRGREFPRWRTAVRKWLFRLGLKRAAVPVPVLLALLLCGCALRRYEFAGRGTPSEGDPTHISEPGARVVVPKANRPAPPGSVLEDPAYDCSEVHEDGTVVCRPKEVGK